MSERRSAFPVHMPLPGGTTGPNLEMDTSLAPTSFPFINVRYRNRPVLRCSAFAHNATGLERPVLNRTALPTRPTILSRGYTYVSLEGFSERGDRLVACGRRDDAQLVIT